MNSKRTLALLQIGVVPGVAWTAIVDNATRLLPSPVSPARLNASVRIVILNHAAPQGDAAHAATAVVGMMKWVLTRVVQVHGS